ncbi:MAG: hypothetical protein IJ125_06205 [Atopobiaceae bacterium]|nr:hypothetical protein [Atopobiaceae bacterium]
MKQLILVGVMVLLAALIAIAAFTCTKPAPQEEQSEPEPTAIIEPQAGTNTSEGTLDSPYIL